MPDDADAYITAAAAGEILEVSPRQAQRLGADADSNVRTRTEGRRVLYHAGDVRALAEQRTNASHVTNTPTRRVSRPNEWRDRYDQAQAKLEAAAHTIGGLEEQVRQLQQQRDARPLLEDHVALQAERDALTRELEQLRAAVEAAKRPWWKRIFST